MLKVVARAPAGLYPDGMAYEPRTGRLFISDEHGRTETVVDTHTNKPIATIALGGDVGKTFLAGTESESLLLLDLRTAAESRVVSVFTYGHGVVLPTLRTNGLWRAGGFGELHAARPGRKVRLDRTRRV